MTCNQCLHRELCNVHGYIDADECGCYKDKSRYIELPCAVGDKIYQVIKPKKSKGNIVEYDVVGFHLGNFPKLKGHLRKQYIIAYHEVTNNMCHIAIDKLGKTVFLTKSQAEQALKGGAE